MLRTTLSRMLAIAIVFPALLTACGGVEEAFDSPADATPDIGAPADEQPADSQAPEAGSDAMPMEGMGDEMTELVQVKLTEFGVESTHSSFETGVAYRFVILNEGVLAHDLRLAPRGEAESMISMNVGSEPHTHGNELIVIPEDELAPGSIQTVDVTFSQPGEYEIACHVEGHFAAGMWQPIDIVGEVLATPTPIDLDSIIFDPNMMPEAPCHLMGTTIMGQCTEEDIAAIKAELLESSGEDEHGHEPDTPVDQGHNEDGDGMMGDEEHVDEGSMMGTEQGEEGHGDEDGGSDGPGEDPGDASGQGGDSGG